jgi:hypothetical protein
VLDAGPGRGAASRAIARADGHPLAADLAFGMLAGELECAAGGRTRRRREGVELVEVEPVAAAEARRVDTLDLEPPDDADPQRSPRTLAHARTVRRRSDA